ncbi:MAG: hypothetical protein ABIJ57_03305 [Pseudomonadota bacterium]
MVLSQIKIIDKRLSKFDAEGSNPKKGEYAWTEKVPWKARRDGSLDEYFVSWGALKRDGTPGPMTQDWQLDGWEFVRPSDNYFPDGLPPNTDGLYVFKDAVLMKIPMKKYLEIRKNNMKRADRGYREMIQQFESQAKAEGVGLDKDMLDKMVEKTVG